MKKVGLIVKEVSEKKIKSTIKESSAVYVIKYSGLKSPDLSSLRMVLKAANANLFVPKNSVARRALKEAGLDTLIKNVEGPCGFVFIKEEPVAASKALCNFSKEHEHLILEGGALKDKILEKKDIEHLASLPSKEVLRAQVVMALNSPISGIVITLNQVLAKFVICLDQIKQKKTS
ncbi:MAG: 50S ribosomal protein L10 [Candidatus Omnitrophica bacterium]|nr:50S ribosomal protein L10 [Candidatus Omnitrophota bacterium]